MHHHLLLSLLPLPPGASLTRTPPPPRYPHRCNMYSRSVTPCVSGILPHNGVTWLTAASGLLSAPVPHLGVETLSRCADFLLPLISTTANQLQFTCVYLLVLCVSCCCHMRTVMCGTTCGLVIFISPPLLVIFFQHHPPTPNTHASWCRAFLPPLQ